MNKQELTLLKEIRECCNGCKEEKASITSLIRLKEDEIEKFIASLLKTLPFLLNLTMDGLRSIAYEEVMNSSRLWVEGKLNYNSYLYRAMRNRSLREYNKQNRVIHVPDSAYKEDASIDLINDVARATSVTSLSELLVEPELKTSFTRNYDFKELEKDLREVLIEVGVVLGAQTPSRTPKMNSIKIKLLARGWDKETIMLVLDGK